MSKHPCECRGKTLDCQMRHLDAALKRFGAAYKGEIIKTADDITKIWMSAFKKLRGN